MKIAVIGTGYVGLVQSVGLAELGNEVFGIDIDKEKITKLKRGVCPIYEPGLEEILKRNLLAGRLHFTIDFNEGIPQSKVIFIAVGTPEGEDGRADLKYVRAAAEMIGETLKKHEKIAAKELKIIVNKSTVPIGTGDIITKLIAKNYQGDFTVVSNPEFLREGQAVKDFFQPDRIVIGNGSDEARKTMAELYAPLGAPILFTNLNTAELIKYASNSFLACSISYINSLSRVAEKVGADITEVAEGMKLDKRIGKQAFLGAGLGYGGSCFSENENIMVFNSPNLKSFSLKKFFQKNLKQIKEKAVLSFDTSQQKSIETPIKFLTKRFYQGDFIEFQTGMGRRIKITADHPMLTYLPEKNRFLVKQAKAVVEKEFFVSPLEIDCAKKEIKIIRILDYLSSSRAIKLRSKNNEFEKYQSRFLPLINEKIVVYKYDITRKNCLPLDIYHHLKSSGFKKINEAKLLLFTTLGAPTYCPAIFRVDENLMRFLGYYLAEGCITKDSGRKNALRERVLLSFGAHEKEYIADAKSILNNWGIKFLEKKSGNSYSIIISSKPFAFFLRDILNCGTNSYNKNLPSIIFNVDQKLKKEFLKGLFSGDGSITKLNKGKNFSYEYATVSRVLAEGVIVLLQSLNIVPALKTCRMNKSKTDAYIVRIYGIKQLKELKNIFGRQKEKIIIQLINKSQKTISQFGFIKKKGFILLPVVKKIISKGKEYVYSMETSNSLLVASGGIVTHNCFPKDIKAMIKIGEDAKVPITILEAADKENINQRKFFYQKIKRAFGKKFRNKKIAIWGLAFKPKTDDLREAPALDVIKMLLKTGAKISAYDPVAEENAKKIFPKITYVKKAYEALKNADGLIVMTEWDEFREVDFKKMKKLMKRALIIDGRNMWSKTKPTEAGFEYHSIGR